MDFINYNNKVSQEMWLQKQKQKQRESAFYPLLESSIKKWQTKHSL
jgi:hypothetical protein